MRPLGGCLICGQKLTVGDSYPTAKGKGRRLVPLRMRRHWCRKCWMGYARRLGRAAQ
jgi:hypothetical protein